MVRTTGPVFVVWHLCEVERFGGAEYVMSRVNLIPCFLYEYDLVPASRRASVKRGVTSQVLRVELLKFMVLRGSYFEFFGSKCPAHIECYRGYNTAP